MTLLVPRVSWGCAACGVSPAVTGAITASAAVVVDACRAVAVSSLSPMPTAHIPNPTPHTPHPTPHTPHSKPQTPSPKPQTTISTPHTQPQNPPKLLTASREPHSANAHGTAVEMLGGLPSPSPHIHGLSSRLRPSTLAPLSGTRFHIVARQEQCRGVKRGSGSLRVMLVSS